MEIKVRAKMVYGRELIYPACETSEKLARLSGRETFTPQALVLIRELGYVITEAPQAPRDWLGALP